MEAVEKQYLKTCVFAIYLVSLSHFSRAFSGPGFRAFQLIVNDCGVLCGVLGSERA